MTLSQGLLSIQDMTGRSLSPYAASCALSSSWSFGCSCLRVSGYAFPSYDGCKIESKIQLVIRIIIIVMLKRLGGVDSSTPDTKGEMSVWGKETIRGSSHYDLKLPSESPSLPSFNSWFPNLSLHEWHHSTDSMGYFPSAEFWHLFSSPDNRLSDDYWCCYGRQFHCCKWSIFPIRFGNKIWNINSTRNVLHVMTIQTIEDCLSASLCPFDAWNQHSKRRLTTISKKFCISLHHNKCPLGNCIHLSQKYVTDMSFIRWCSSQESVPKISNAISISVQIIFMKLFANCCRTGGGSWQSIDFLFSIRSNQFQHQDDDDHHHRRRFLSDYINDDSEKNNHKWLMPMIWRKVKRSRRGE